MRKATSGVDAPVLPPVVYTIAKFCDRNRISRLTYRRLRAEGRGPVEMRLGLNKILITANAERDWHELMQKPRPDLETRTVERAVMAGAAAINSSEHASKRRKRKRVIQK